MKEITSEKDYNLIQKQSNVAVAILFYAKDDIESSMAEVSMNNLDKKYSGEMFFSKLAVDEKEIRVNNQYIELPVVQILNEGSQILFRNPIDFNELENRLIQLLKRKEYSALTSLPPRPERIKRRLLERKWIAWAFIIGAALIAIIKFIVELDKNSDSKKRQ